MEEQLSKDIIELQTRHKDAVRMLKEQEAVYDKLTEAKNKEIVRLDEEKDNVERAIARLNASIETLKKEKQGLEVDIHALKINLRAEEEDLKRRNKILDDEKEKISSMRAADKIHNDNMLAEANLLKREAEQKTTRNDIADKELSKKMDEANAKLAESEKNIDIVKAIQLSVKDDLKKIEALRSESATLRDDAVKTAEKNELVLRSIKSSETLLNDTRKELAKKEDKLKGREIDVDLKEEEVSKREIRVEKIIKTKELKGKV